VRRIRRTFRAVLFPAWEQWVVHVPDAHDVHSIVMDPSEAAAVARAAIVTVLGIEADSIRIVMTATPGGRARGSTPRGDPLVRRVSARSPWADSLATPGSHRA